MSDDFYNWYKDRKVLIKQTFDEFNKKLFDLGVELDDHAEFNSLLRDINTGKIIAIVRGNEIDDWEN